MYKMLKLKLNMFRDDVFIIQAQNKALRQLGKERGVRIVICGLVQDSEDSKDFGLIHIFYTLFS